jgi:hypothetical protein
MENMTVWIRKIVLAQRNLHTVRGGGWSMAYHKNAVNLQKKKSVINMI